MRVLLWLALALGLTLGAHAHTASRSFSAWTIEDRTAIGIVETDSRRVTQLIGIVQGDDLTAILGAHAAATIHALQGAASCAPASAQPMHSEPGVTRVRLTITCPEPIAAQSTRLDVRLFEGISPGHVHYVRVDGQTVVEAALTQRNAQVMLSGDPGPASAFGFILSGAEHVLGGLDHLAFLAALALLAGSIWRVALAATGFTLGHSITLALVTLGIVTPIESAVEMLIGFTIAFAAAEALGGAAAWPRALAFGGVTLAAPLVALALGFAPPPLAIYAGAALFAACAALVGADRSKAGAPLLATLFGLVHGAGFAGALKALSLPPERIAPALFGFNVGVELGQIVALAGFAATAAVAARLPMNWRAPLRAGLTTALLALGVFWFSQRTFIPA